MTDDLEKLASLSEKEKSELLDWYQKLPEGEEELDKLVNTPNRSGKRKWTDNPELVERVDALLWSIMGPDSPYQFANYRQLYEAYRRIQDKLAPYSEYLGAQYFQFFVRKWIIKNNIPWNDKSQRSRNKVTFKMPDGTYKRYAGFGKKKLTRSAHPDAFNFHFQIDINTVWNSEAYFHARPAFYKPEDKDNSRFGYTAEQLLKAGIIEDRTKK